MESSKLFDLHEMWTDGALAWPMACFVAKKEMANTGAQFFFFSFWGMVIKTMSLKQGKI